MDLKTSSLPTWQVVLSTVADKGPGLRPSPRGRTETDERNGLGLPGYRRILVYQVQTLGYYLRRNFPGQELGAVWGKVAKIKLFLFCFFQYLVQQMLKQ